MTRKSFTEATLGVATLAASDFYLCFVRRFMTRFCNNQGTIYRSVKRICSKSWRRLVVFTLQEIWPAPYPFQYLTIWHFILGSTSQNSDMLSPIPPAIFSNFRTDSFSLTTRSERGCSSSLAKTAFGGIGGIGARVRVESEFLNTETVVTFHTFHSYFKYTSNVKAKIDPHFWGRTANFCLLSGEWWMNEFTHA